MATPSSRLRSLPRYLHGSLLIIDKQAQVEMDDPTKEILEQVMADLIRQSPELRRAILEVVLSCPHYVTAI